MSALDYPVPGSAAYIWHRGDALCLGLPGENGIGHTVVIPIAKLGLDGTKAEQRGWRILLDILSARAHETGRAQLSTPAMPTRTQVEALLAGRSVPAFDEQGRRKLAGADLWERKGSDE